MALPLKISNLIGHFIALHKDSFEFWNWHGESDNFCIVLAAICFYSIVATTNKIIKANRHTVFFPFGNDWV